MELRVANGPLAGLRFPLLEGENVVGRGPKSQVRLADPSVAWVHCRVMVREGCAELYDLNTAGTWVNGVKVKARVLAEGDQVEVGETVLEFRVRSDEAARGADSATTLLCASMLLFAFRGMAASEGAARRRFGLQIEHLVRDLATCSEVRAGLFSEDDAKVVPGALLDAVRGGTVFEGGGWLGVPLLVFGQPEGFLAARAEAGELATLTAIATMGCAGLENAREIEQERAQRVESNTGLMGDGAPMLRLREQIARVAPRDVTVLILGESGTGKELVAHAIHRLSERRGEAFVAINCAAISENLLESELFGHEKGAFTGAVVQKRGKLEIAQGGTVFLDEIGELAAPLQAKLLRVLQQRVFERVGGTKTFPLDIRLVAATNRDLAAEVKRGAFREDLYHRLNVITLRTPPLREHPEDIVPLARHFLACSAARCRRRVEGFSVEAERLLAAYGWPGNVRELENAVERAVVLGSAEVILPEDLPESLLEVGKPVESSYQSSVLDAKRAAIVQAYAQAEGDYKGAAKILGVHPNYLLRLVRNLDMKQAVKEAGRR
ncbi:MAG: sigma 54-interacting transcriptional regulator [Bryobacteraceae bacterium]|nr:sigma 54-interacting transcriptional regulator [Bryobacteraceae bacterium]